MKILNGLIPIDALAPLCLTIGNFDGFHLGHQFVIDSLVSETKKLKTQSAVMTFDDHPSKILRPGAHTKHISTLSHKIKLLEQAQVDFLILLTFTAEFSNQTPEDFLQRVQETIPFSTLILGYDAAIGKDRAGTPARIAAYANDFEAISLQPYKLDGTIVSSSLIRTHIQQGNLAEASRLLGRLYSIHGTVIKGEGKGRVIGFPTANIAVDGLCLPPCGVYAVSVNYQDRLHKAIANLGVAPTVRTNTTPLLEIHLLDAQPELYGQQIEVIFKDFIRPEKSFASFDALKAQIQEDIRYNFS